MTITILRRIVCGVALLLGAFSESAGAADAHGPYTLSADSSLILVPVTVTDRNGKLATDLQPRHFRIFDNSEPREIVSCSLEEAPVVIGLVVDLSGSMERKLPYALAAVRAVTKTAGLDDEGFLITFSSGPVLREDFTSDLAALADSLQFERGRGGTALIDAIYMALEKTRTIKNKRRAIVVVSDGGDNSSRFRESELAALAREADTQIYSISVHENSISREERAGFYLLEDLAKITGGLHFYTRSRRELPEMAERIAVAMKSLYVIGYKPPQTADRGKWRKIRVALSDDIKKTMRVTARSGYYSPE